MSTSTTTATLLSQLHAQLNVDMDSYAPDLALSLPFKPADATSNQGFILVEMSRPENASLLRQIVTSTLAEKSALNGSNGSIHVRTEVWEVVYDRMVAAMAAKISDLIEGRVLCQVSPRFAYDMDKTLDHARRYAQAYANVGIGKDKFCIKLPSTGASLNAARILLQQDGIATLGTALFSVPQAIAASQAGTLYISPYFNEIAAHFDPALVPKTDDPALEHPNAARMVQIAEVFRVMESETGQRQPFIKAASFLTPLEPLFFGELPAHSITVPGPILLNLASSAANPSLDALPVKSQRGSTLPSIPSRLAHLLQTDGLDSTYDQANLDRWRAVDWLADGGAKLEEFVRKEPGGITSGRLKDALVYFQECEDKSKALIEEVIKSVQGVQA